MTHPSQHERLIIGLAKQGLVKNELWVPTTVQNCMQVFGDVLALDGTVNVDIKVTAGCMGAVDQWAADYLRQAPILALAINRNRSMIDVRGPLNRTDAALKWRTCRSNNSKLPALMRNLKIEGLRDIPIHSVTRTMWKAMQFVRWVQTDQGITGADIANYVAQNPTQWLVGVADFIEQLSSHNASAVSNYEFVLRNAHRTGIRAVADFIAMGSREFRPTWSWERAIREMERWHEHLARNPMVTQVTGIPILPADFRVNYSPFPDAYVASKGSAGWSMHALASQQDLFDEGKAMSHCVASYFPNVYLGKSRIYSIRFKGERHSTVEFSRAGTEIWYAPAGLGRSKAKCANPGWAVNQHQPFNDGRKGHKVSAEAQTLVAWFLKDFRSGEFRQERAAA